MGASSFKDAQGQQSVGFEDKPVSGSSSHALHLAGSTGLGRGRDLPRPMGFFWVSPQLGFCTVYISSQPGEWARLRSFGGCTLGFNKSRRSFLWDTGCTHTHTHTKK